jgi:hypothetical protein
MGAAFLFLTYVNETGGSADQYCVSKWHQIDLQQDIAIQNHSLPWVAVDSLRLAVVETPL